MNLLFVWNQSRFWFYVFTKDSEFSSPSAMASVIHGGGANGLTEWRTEPSDFVAQKGFPDGTEST